LFAPFLYNGDVLVDGGVMNNFPVDIMRKVVEQGTVIGCHAGALPAKMRNYDFGPSISGWKILWSKLNPFVRSVRVPSLATTLLRSVEINTVYHLPSLQHYADMLIQPPVETFPVFDFSRYDDLIDIGYHAAREPIIAWKRSELRRRGSVPGESDNRL
jgi:predicted acylesterase/phospholipase RssA